MGGHIFTEVPIRHLFYGEDSSVKGFDRKDREIKSAMIIVHVPNEDV